MCSTIKAVSPYIYSGLNFKNKAYNAWKELGFPTTKGFYPKIFRWILFKKDIFPTIYQKDRRLVFVQPVSLYFDAGTTVLTHEIIPFIWDCWPCYYDKLEKWIKRHNIKTAVFTSSQEMEKLKRRLPYLNVIHCPEGTDTSSYLEGKELESRNIDILEFGRSTRNIFDTSIPEFKDFNIIKTSDFNTRIDDNTFQKLLCNAKITICFPKNMTHPNIAKGIETLTQRYWEAMLSRTIIIGHCPKELSDLIGYNPVIEINNQDDALTHIPYILKHIKDYQALVDKNRETAIKLGSWKTRMDFLIDALRDQYSF